MLKAENIRYLVVHCADTPDDQPLDASDIHQMHLGFGWNGIGYHRVICRDGCIEHGRPDYWIGAHVKGFNEISLGVCLIGRQDFTDAQFAALETVLREWRDAYPDAKICGHRDFDYTDKTSRISMSGNGVKRLVCKIDGAVSHYHPIGSFAIWRFRQCRT